MELKFLGMDFSCVFGSLSKGEFPEKDCLLPLISKLLGYAIVAASTTVKLPQILKILSHKSIRGLSVVAFELELLGYTIALGYCLHKGLPFSAFGEYCGIAPTILAGKIDPILFEALFASQYAIFLFARIPQIWQNFKLTPFVLKEFIILFWFLVQNKSTGQLSFLTFFMNFAGSMGKPCNSDRSLFSFSNSESFYQHPRKSSNECCYGFCAWYIVEWHHLESNHPLCEANPKEGKENKLEVRPASQDIEWVDFTARFSCQEPWHFKLDHLLNVHATKFRPVISPNLALKEVDLPVLLDAILPLTSWPPNCRFSWPTSGAPPSLAAPSGFSNSVVSKFTAMEPLLALNQSAPSVVTNLHFLTFTLIKFGHPLARASIPWSVTGQLFIQSFFNAEHFAAIQESSGSPTVSLPHKANLSKFTQFVASFSKLVRVGFTPIKTNSFGNCSKTGVTNLKPFKVNLDKSAHLFGDHFQKLIPITRAPEELKRLQILRSNNQRQITLSDAPTTPGPIGSAAAASVMPRRRFTDNSSSDGQLSSTAFMPLDPKVQDPQESFFKPLQFFTKASIPASVSSRHDRSFKRVRFRHRRDISTKASSPILTDLRSHFKASFVTASNRENMEGTTSARSASALSERRCRLCPSIRNHRLQTREHRFRSPELRHWNIHAKHSSGILEV
nr:mannose-P-dolichol utilization defect 1 protein homolog 2-like [Ipomoea batatas]